MNVLGKLKERYAEHFSNGYCQNLRSTLLYSLSHVFKLEEEILLVAIATSLLAGGVGLKKDQRREQRKIKDKYCNQSPLLYNPIVNKGKK